MKIYDRSGNEVIVDQGQNNLLKLLYSHLLGRCLLKVLTLPFITHIGGKYMNSSLSKHKISPFIEKNHIDMSQYVQQSYQSYNDFFTRCIKEGQRPIAKEKEILIAPADSKLTYYPIFEDTHLKIKDTIYSIEDLLQSQSLAKDYEGGVCLIFRLTVDDYHRYCFIDKGTKEKDVYIPGVFHTVNPIANDYYPIYKQNSRSYSLLHTENFGDVIYMEVGAMMVGRIVNHDKKTFEKGEEKGYFEFGGSTIVALFQKDKVIIDEDIIQNSKTHDETRVLMGEKIGVKRVEL
ncbi:MAG: phosphatidylserine decarboxylase [Longibaculum sp.]